MTAVPTEPIPPPRRGRLTGAERRAQIIAAARTVFAEHGLNGARTRDLAAAADINEAMLYRHFSSKEEIFEAAVGQPLEDAVTSLRTSAGEPPEEFSGNAELQREQTRAFVHDLCVIMEETGQLLGVAMFGQAEASQFFADRIQPTLTAIEDVLRANYDSWPHRPFDPELIVRWLFGMTWFMTVADRQAGITRDLDYVADQITMTLLDGLFEDDSDSAPHGD